LILETQSQVSKAGRAIRLHGKKVTKIELHNYILDLIENENITGTDDLSKQLGKTPKQTRRYLVEMAQEGKITLDADTGRLQKTQKAINLEKFEKLTQDDFGQIREISRWMNNLTCKPKIAANYKYALKRFFDKILTTPASALTSKQAFIETWKTFKQIHDADVGAGHDQIYRVAYRSLGDEFDFHINLALGKKIGLTSKHDSYKKYAGAALQTALTKIIGKEMLENKDYEVYTWFRTGVRTGGRTGAIATMTWDKIVFDENNFEVAQHETKDARGDNWLGEDGEWQIKLPAIDLLKVLKHWKSHDESPNSKFVWFEDKGNDIANRKAAQKVRERVIKKLRTYLEKHYDEMDILTREYAQLEPGHLLRHTFAQLLRDEGATSDQIQTAGCWKSAETVAWYTAAGTKEKKEIRGKQNQVDSFSQEESDIMLRGN